MMTNKITLAVRFIKAYKKHIIVEDDNKEVSVGGSIIFGLSRENNKQISFNKSDLSSLSRVLKKYEKIMITLPAWKVDVDQMISVDYQGLADTPPDLEIPGEPDTVDFSLYFMGESMNRNAFSFDLGYGKIIFISKKKCKIIDIDFSKGNLVEVRLPRWIAKKMD